MKYNIAIIAVLALVSCNGRFGGKTTNLVNDGHNYQWIEYGDKFQLVHSPECDSCKAIRKQEVIAIVDSIVKDRITIAFEHVDP